METNQLFTSNASDDIMLNEPFFDPKIKKVVYQFCFEASEPDFPVSLYPLPISAQVGDTIDISDFVEFYNGSEFVVERILHEFKGDEHEITFILKK